MVLKIVEENTKQRFELVWGSDQSPPRLGGKGKSHGKKRTAPALNSGERPMGCQATDGANGTSGPNDAAEVDDLRHDLGRVAVSEVDPPSPSVSISTELPLILLSSQQPDPRDPPDPSDLSSRVTSALQGVPEPQWFIRARQGHSIVLDSVAHLTPVRDDEDGRRAVGEMVHGTKWELWDVIRESC